MRRSGIRFEPAWHVAVSRCASGLAVLMLASGCAGTKTAAVSPAPEPIAAPAPAVRMPGRMAASTGPGAAATQVPGQFDVREPFRCMQAWAQGVTNAVAPGAFLARAHDVGPIAR